MKDSWFVMLLIALSSFLMGAVLGVALPNTPVEDFTFGAEYKISIMDGFEETELTIPRNQCGPTIIIKKGKDAVGWIGKRNDGDMATIIDEDGANHYFLYDEPKDEWEECLDDCEDK